MSSRSNISTRQRLWKALRVQKTCDALILAAAADAPETSAREYLGLLVRSGYVEITAHANGKAGRINRYRIVRDTGPRAPRRVFDFMQDENTGAMQPLLPAQNNRRPNLSGGGMPRQMAMVGAA
jgi:predicted ArsR family transcriptional regulator